ncbi:MAG: hypothetical protein WC683_02530 [bacterium]
MSQPPPKVETPTPSADTLNDSPAETIPAPSPAEAPKDELEAMAEGCEANLSIMVRGGTSTYAHDMAEKKRWAEAEARRDMLERYQQIANTPIEKGGGVMYSKQFADPLSSPRVLLRYVNSKKETLCEMLCELIESDTTGDLILQFVCPECVKRGVHMDAAQCTVRDTHRKWFVDTKCTGEMRKAETVDMRGNKILEPYLHAGDIVDTEMLTCDRCATAYKIHKNMLYRVWGK